MGSGGARFGRKHVMQPGRALPAWTKQKGPGIHPAQPRLQCWATPPGVRETHFSWKHRFATSGLRPGSPFDQSFRRYHPYDTTKYIVYELYRPMKVNNKIPQRDHNRDIKDKPDHTDRERKLSS